MSRKSISKPVTSPFASVLLRLLDETGFYTRAQWGKFLGVSEPALSQWVNDRTIPRADLLRMVVDALRTRGGAAAKDAVSALDGLMDEPAEQISPIGSRFAPDLRTYLRVRSFSEIGRAASRLEGPWAIQGSQVARPREMEVPMMDWDLQVVVNDGHAPAWRAPRLVRENGPHGRERQVSVEEFAGANRIVVVGSAGAGKSALVAHLLVEYSPWKSSDKVSVRQFRATDLASWLAAREGKVPLIIDGLDEMEADERALAANLIDEFARTTPDVPIIVASRPVIELERLSNFQRYSIAPLSDVEVVAEVTRSVWALQNPVETDRFLCHMVERQTLMPVLRDPLFLKTAWSLFEHSAITPFADGMIIEKYIRGLIERDHAHGFSRAREPWANHQNVLALLSEISMHLFMNQNATFELSDVSSWLERSPRNAPARSLLDLLLVLGLLREEGQRYSFSHRIFADYFVARFITESSAKKVRHWDETARRALAGDAIRLAGGMANDATHLLETVMVEGGPDCSNLARMLAQPIVAEPRVLRDSCRMVVTWLNERTSDWKVEEQPFTADFNSARWIVCAKMRRRKEEDAVAVTLRAIHQARSGPAGAPLAEQLVEAGSPFLSVFAEALEVDGRLNVGFEEVASGSGLARVSVGSLQMA